MGSLRDAIMNSGSDNKLDNTMGLIIEQKFNKLFYAPQQPELETSFVNSVLHRNGAQADRVGLHASSIIVGDTDFCYREQVLSLFFKQLQGKQIPVNLKRIFEAGNSIHEKWQRLFLRGGLSTVEDLDRSRFLEKYDLSFTPDAIITLAGTKYIVEIKSMNTYQFKQGNEHPSGKKQLYFYMWLCKIRHGIVLVEDKNNQNFSVFPYEFNPSIVAPFVDRLKEIRGYKNEFMHTKKLTAPKLCDSSTCKRAQKCPMVEACFNTGAGRVRLE